MTAAQRRRRIPEVLELVGLSGRASDRLRTFSKGMLQRVGLAQAILNEPELVFLWATVDYRWPILPFHVERAAFLRRGGDFLSMPGNFLSPDRVSLGAGGVFLLPRAGVFKLAAGRECGIAGFSVKTPCRGRGMSEIQAGQEHVNNCHRGNCRGAWQVNNFRESLPQRDGPGNREVIHKTTEMVRKRGMRRPFRPWMVRMRGIRRSPARKAQASCTLGSEATVSLTLLS